MIKLSEQRRIYHYFPIGARTIGGAKNGLGVRRSERRVINTSPILSSAIYYGLKQIEVLLKNIPLLKQGGLVGDCVGRLW